MVWFSKKKLVTPPKFLPNLNPNFFNRDLAVKILDSCLSLLQIKQVHAVIITKELDQCSFIITKLLRMLTKLDIPMDAYPSLIFSRVRSPNPFLYTALIRGFSLQGMLRESVSWYGEMRRNGVKPTSFTVTALLKLNCSYLGCGIHGQSVKIGGFCQDLYVGNALIDIYGECGRLVDAEKVFDEMPRRDVISWTSLIDAYVKNGEMDRASDVFDRLPVKDTVAWTSMVTGFARNAQPMEALVVFERMQSAGVCADEVTLSSVVSACAQLGLIRKANWVREVVEKAGFFTEKDVVIGSALIDMYSRCGSLEEACRVFKSMKERNVVTYSSMIVGFAIHGCPKEALSLFEEMIKNSVKPNEFTFVGVLSACSHAGLVEQGQRVFETMEKCHGVSPSEDHYTSMVDLLGRAGRLEEAVGLILRLQTMSGKPRASIWGALLGACRIHKNPEVAEMAVKQLFELEPDVAGNYVLLSHIYASAGRWEDVKTVRKMMRGKGLNKPSSRSMVEDDNGVIHEFYSDDMTHPKHKDVKMEVVNMVDKLKTIGYRPILSSVPYDVDDREKERILLYHSEKLALAYMLSTTYEGSAIRIIKNLRICEDCHSVMSRISKLTGRVIIVRDNARFHHFSNGMCSCGNFW